MGEFWLLSSSRLTGRQPACTLLLALLLTFNCKAQVAGKTAADLGATGEAAVALEQQGKLAEAETVWRAVLKTHPSSAQAYAHLGLLEAQQERYKTAEPMYRKALALNPQMPGLHLNLGLAFFKGGDLKQAIPEFQLLLKTQTSASLLTQRLTILIGMAHYGLGEFALAAPYLKQAAQNDAQSLPLRLALAHSCLWSKQYQCVLDTYHEILTLNAESAEADMLAGEASDELSDHGGAIEQFRAAAQANSNEPDVHFGLGYLLWGQKQFDEAASEFRAELANNPKQAEAMAYLGDTEMQLNHPELSPPLLEKAAEIDPRLELAHLDLGILDADAGRNDEALREMKLAAKLAPDDVNVHWRMGRLYRAMGKRNEAKDEFDKAANLHKATDNALLDRMSGPHAQPAPDQASAATAPKH
jgi:tetratricopeptide (TPR) repeat protein